MTVKYLKISHIYWSKVVFLLILFCILLLSAYIQFNTYMNLDASNGLHESELLFSGGKYFYDFYETTPPLFLYLNFPIFETLKHIGNDNFFIVFFIYYVFIAYCSISLCAFLSKKIFDGEKSFFRMLFLLAIAAVFLIELPLFFGEREHMAIMLAMPYFLLLSLRIDKKEISPTISFIVALFAGIGFAIKPQFCIPFFLSELYLLARLKKFSAIIRIENITIVSLFFVYLISTYFLYPAYFHIIIPQSAQFYYEGATQSLLGSLKLPTFIFSLLIILFYTLECKNTHLKLLSNSLFVGLVGFIITFFSQFSMWEYHFFPAYSLMLILAFTSTSRFLMRDSDSSIQRIAYIALLLLFYLFYVVYHFTQGNFNYCLIALVIFSCATFFLKKYFWQKTLHKISGVTLLLFILVYPIFTDYIGYQHFKQLKKDYQPLVGFIKKYAYHKSVYFLAATLDYEYPIVSYGGGISVSRFPYLIWMPSYIKQMLKSPNSAEGLKSKEIYHYFMQLMSKDIIEKKPQFIFIDMSQVIQTISFQASGINYLSLFLRTPEFKTALDNYHYVTSINNEPHYKFDVYELNNITKGEK